MISMAFRKALNIFFDYYKDSYSKKFHMKTTGPKSIPNKPCGVLHALLCWTAICRCFPGLLTWWCSLHIRPPFWCYSAFHKLPALYTHQPQGSQSDQSPSVVFVHVSYHLTSMIASCPWGHQVTWLPFQLPWNCYFITYSIK